MLVQKQFILVSAAIALGSLTIGAILTTPTALDASIAYHRSATMLQASSTSVLLPTLPSETETPLSHDEEGMLSVATIAEQDGRALDSIQEEELLVAQVPVVPFYSQFEDITAPSWKKVGCGIASLAMLIEYYKPDTVEVDTLLEEGIQARAYLDSAGWTYAGLIGIAKKYSIKGETHDYGGLNMEEAYTNLLSELKEGPVMASVHYTFQKSNPIPHLVVITGIKDGAVFYNDPAEKHGGGTVSVAQFQSAWKKRAIEFRPL